MSVLAYLIVFVFPAHSQENDSLEALSQSRKWHVLMHYRKSIFGNLRSEVDSKDFFFSLEGKTNPLSEITASIDAMKSDAVVGVLKQNPQCAYPARYRFLKENLPLDTFQDRACEDFQNWFFRFRAKRVSLMFASAYLNNPASMFGHTFLKIGSEQNELLDNVVNFGASTGNDGLIAFALQGVFGGYAGIFSIGPYHLKVSEYSAVESRDLWEYPLPFNEIEIRDLLEHLWELGGNYFDYYFFDENCSYQILGLLDAAKPDWGLLKNFASLSWVVPSDTLRWVLSRTTPLIEPRFRPSLERKLSAAIDSGKVSKLDIEIEKMNLKIMGSKGKPKESTTQTLQFLLKERSAQSHLPPPESLYQITPPTRPELGHGTSKTSAGFNFQSKQLTLTYRPLLHDGLDSTFGYLPGSTLEVATLELGIGTAKASPKIQFREFKIFELTSISSVTLPTRPISWRVRTKIVEQPKFLCASCNALEAFPALGLGFGNKNSEMPHLVYLLGGVRMLYGSSLRPRWELGPGFISGFISHFSEIFAFQLSLETIWTVLGKKSNGSRWRANSEAVFRGLAGDLEIRLGLKGFHLQDENEWAPWGALGFYF